MRVVVVTAVDSDSSCVVYFHRNADLFGNRCISEESIWGQRVCLLTKRFGLKWFDIVASFHVKIIGA